MIFRVNDIRLPYFDPEFQLNSRMDHCKLVEKTSSEFDHDFALRSGAKDGGWKVNLSVAYHLRDSGRTGLIISTNHKGLSLHGICCTIYPVEATYRKIPGTIPVREQHFLIDLVMNILVVGGAGYVGGAVTDILLRSPHNVRVYDALLYEDVYRKPVEFVYGDVRDAERMRVQLRWADAVIWLAALVGDGACQVQPEVSSEVNEQTVRWLAKNYSGRIVFMSTCSVYGALHDRILDERAPAQPLSVYAETKLAAEKHLTGSNAIIFRLGTLFGVGDEYSRIRLDLVVNTLTVRAWRDKKITVFGGEQFRPLLHVRDAARAAIEAASKDQRGIYNLVHQNVRIADLAYQVRNHFPDTEIEHVSMSFEDSRNYRASGERARTELVFRPAGSIDEGITELRDLLESHRIKVSDDPRYSNYAYLSRVNRSSLFTWNLKEKLQPEGAVIENA